MNILDLPNELLLQIFTDFQDVYLYMNLALVCKRFQTIIRKIVLVLGDTPHQSRLFKSIASNYLFMNGSAYHPLDLKSIRSHSYFILEYRNKLPADDGILEQDYVRFVISNRASKLEKVVEVFLTKTAITSREASKLHPEHPEIHRTIFIDEAAGKEQIIPDLEFAALGVSSHEYEFYNVEKLPTIYLTVNSQQSNFTIHSKTLRSLEGIVNTTMTRPRLAPLLKFFEFSYMPNLTHIHDISIEAGNDLSMFEKFESLKFISVQSAFTGNLKLQISRSESFTVLKSLESFNITGNAVSLSSLYLPKLKNFSMELYGSNTRTFSETLFFEDIKCPALKSLNLTITLPGGLAYVVKGLTKDLKSVQKMKLSSDSGTFPQAFEHLQFDEVVELEIQHNDISILDDHLLPREQKIPVDQPLSIKTDYMKFPKLEVLNLPCSDKFLKSFLDEKVQYPLLRKLLIVFRVSDTPKEYSLDKIHFPMLEHLKLSCINRYSPLKPPNITIHFTRLPHIKVLDCDPQLRLMVV